MQVAKLATNASGAIWWPNLQPIQEVSLKPISNCSSWEIYSSCEINTLGPLCLWQCFFIGQQRESVCVSTSGKSRWSQVTMVRLGKDFTESELFTSQDFEILWHTRENRSQCTQHNSVHTQRVLFFSQCQSHFPFSPGQQSFVSDLSSCQKQRNLRTKCGIIYAEKETSDMKRDKKKKLTESEEKLWAKIFLKKLSFLFLLLVSLCICILYICICICTSICICIWRNSLFCLFFWSALQLLVLARFPQLCSCWKWNLTFVTSVFLKIILFYVLPRKSQTES